MCLYAVGTLHYASIVAICSCAPVVEPQCSEFVLIPLCGIGELKISII